MIEISLETIDKLINNAESRYKSNPMKARYGLELAERLLAEQRIKDKKTYYDVPYIDYVTRIAYGWIELNKIEVS